MSDSVELSGGGDKHPLALGLFLLGAATLALRDVISSAIDLSLAFVDPSVFQGLPASPLTPAVVNCLAVLSILYGIVGFIEGVKGLMLGLVRRALGFLGAAVFLGYVFVLIGRLALYINFPLLWIVTVVVEFYIVVAIGSCLAESLRPAPKPAQSLLLAPKRPSPAPLLDLIADSEKRERDLKRAQAVAAAPKRKEATAEEKRLAKEEADYWRFVQRMPMRQRVLYL